MKYQKIAGEALTVDQFREVQESLSCKYDVQMPSWTTGKEFWFSKDGRRFLEVWRVIYLPVSDQRMKVAQDGFCTVEQGASDGEVRVTLRKMEQNG